MLKSKTQAEDALCIASQWLQTPMTYMLEGHGYIGDQEHKRKILTEIDAAIDTLKADPKYRNVTVAEMRELRKWVQRRKPDR